MSAAKSAPVNKSAPAPLAPTGSILQKQSSFSRPQKSATAQPGTAGGSAPAAPASGAPKGSAPPPPPGMWGPNNELLQRTNGLPGQPGAPLQSAPGPYATPGKPASNPPSNPAAMAQAPGAMPPAVRPGAPTNSAQAPPSAQRAPGAAPQQVPAPGQPGAPPVGQMRAPAAPNAGPQQASVPLGRRNSFLGNESPLDRKSSMGSVGASAIGSMGNGSTGAQGFASMVGSQGANGAQPMGGSLYGQNGTSNANGTSMMSGFGSAVPGSMTSGAPGSAYGAGNAGSMYGMGNPGSMNAGPNSSLYGMNKGGSANAAPGGSMYGMSSAYGAGNPGSMNAGPNSSLYGMNKGGSANAAPGGSMYGMSSAYGAGNPGSMNAGPNSSVYGMNKGGSANAAPGGSMYGMGSAYGAGNPGSMNAGPNSSLYGMNKGGSVNMAPGGSMYGMGSAYGAGNPGSMNAGPNSSLYGMNKGGSANAAPGSMMGGMGSMYGGPGSMYGGPGSMYGGPGSMYGGPGSMMGGMGSMYGGPGSMVGGMGSMYRPMGSMYGMGAPQPPTSAYGFAAQWGSLADMAGTSADQDPLKKVEIEDLCPNLETLEGAPVLKRSGRRGGNHLYNRDRNDTTAPVVTSNAYSNTMTIKRKEKEATPKASTPTSVKATPPTVRAPAAGAKPRAKVPTNYNIHSLIVVEGDGKSSTVVVSDPSAIVFEKSGKKETFECDEGISRTSSTEEVDSVLLSELRGNWIGGHNSSLLLSAGKGLAGSSVDVARSFLKTSVARLEKNQKDSSTQFDININMVSIQGADMGMDLLKSGSKHQKLQLGSSPIYGPCLLGLETKVAKSSKECLSIFNEGFEASKEEKEIIVCFFVLKQVKKASTETEVHLSSLCVALFREEVSHLLGIKDKSSSEPHRLLRYAVDGPSVTVCAVCLSDKDANALQCLEMTRKMRDVKNRPPRSGNVLRFVEFTRKEIARQREKAQSCPEQEKKIREMQAKRMEEMVKDAQDLVDNPEKTQPKGYGMGG